MAKESNQKLKLLYLLKALYEESDEEHFVSMKYLTAYLSSHGIYAERKSVYSDICELERFGFDIISKKGRNAGYALVGRSFETAQLKLLCDSVNASRFITEKKSRELIKKIEGLTSRHSAKKLNRQLYTTDRVKSGNETIYYNVDTLHDAISEKKKVAFMYFEYNTDKQKVMKNGGAEYVVSPYALTFSDENYYLVSHYEKHGNLTNFRVDKMEKIRILKEECENIENATQKGFKLSTYTKRLFGMFAGSEVNVKLLCENSLVNAVTDRFGRDILIRKEGSEHFVATINVADSPTFFAWVFTFGRKMKIISPPEISEKFKNMAQSVCDIYK